MIALANASLATDVIPGDAASVRSLARRVSGYAEDAARAGSRLRGIDAGSWVGEAADAFRDALGEVPDRLSRGVPAFYDAAGALERYADALEDAQEEAAAAIRLFEDAESRSASWSASVQSHEAAKSAAADGADVGPAPPAVDPGADLRAQAEAKLAAAREAVEDAARAAAAILQRAGDEAPNEPGLLSKAWGSAKDFAGGAWDATYGMGEFVFKTTTVYQMIDPEGYAQNMQQLAAGLKYGLSNPKEFAKAALNWEMWAKNPARALGELAPTLLLTFATAGGGAAVKGATGVRRLGAAGKRLGSAARARKLAKAANARARIADTIVDGAAPIKKTSKAVHYQKKGGLAQAQKDFAALTKGHNVNTSVPGKRTVKFEDGSSAGVREYSTEGSPTLQINPATGKKIKVRYEE